MLESCRIIEEADDAATTPTALDNEGGDESKTLLNADESDADESRSQLANTTTSTMTATTTALTSSGTSNSMATQTRLRAREMRAMISLADISENAVVMLTFSERHNSFAVHCTNSAFYFVKQRSLRNIGVENAAEPARSTIIFARVLHVELCETKKAPNRLAT